MKTYRNEKHGFEINIPEDWAPVPSVAMSLLGRLFGFGANRAGKDCFQYGCHDEAFNFEIGPLFPEPSLEDTRIQFTQFAWFRGFTKLKFDNILVMDKQHVCASYTIGDKMGNRWNRKYMIVFGGVEYAISGTCNDPQYFEQREKGWDAIIRSFRLFIPVDDSAKARDHTS